MVAIKKNRKTLTEMLQVFFFIGENLWLEIPKMKIIKYICRIKRF